MDTLVGILLVSVAGLGTGTIAWPMKLMRRLRFEHYWFVGLLLGLVIIPWTVVLTAVSDPWSVYAEVGWRPLVVSNLFAVGWGVANVLYGVCVVRIGAALTGAILSGMGVTVGVTLPMILKGTGQFAEAPDLLSTAGLAMMAGVVVMLLGVVVCSVAGFGREKAISASGKPLRQAGGGFLGGLIMSVVAGVTSAGIALSFVYSQGPIVAAVKSQGAGEISANMAVWAAALAGGAVVNLLYPAWLMTRARSWHLLIRGGTDLLLAAAIGTQFIVSVSLMGVGMRWLGALGASMGFGIQQAMQVLGNQVVGFASGEWRGVRGVPRLLMIVAVVALVFAVVVLALGRTFASG